MAYRESRPVFHSETPRRLTAIIDGHAVTYHSYYAEPPEDCNLCLGDGIVFPVWYREPNLEEARLLKKAGRPLEPIQMRDPPEDCYRCEGTGYLKKEWKKRLSMDEVRALLIRCTTC